MSKEQDLVLNEITRGIRRRVKAGREGGELFARSRADWHRRVDGMADAVKSCVRPDASESAQAQLLDTVCSLAAAAYFAALPES